MKAILTELRKLLPTELHREIQMKRSEAQKIRIGVTLGKEKNHAQLRAMRRDIARMRMVENEMRKGLKKDGQNATLAAPEKKTKSMTTNTRSTKKTTNTKKTMNKKSPKSSDSSKSSL